MKKAAIFALLAVGTLFFAGCGRTGDNIQGGKPIVIGDNDGVSATLEPKMADRFEVNVGSDPIRIDVYHDHATADGEISVLVSDGSKHPYAYTKSRAFFYGIKADKQKIGVSATDVATNLPYSINLPANFGKAYILVKNLTSSSQSVTVKAFTRKAPVRKDTEVDSPPQSKPEEVYGGAIVFLGQKDTYVFTGEDNSRIYLTVPGEDYLKLKLQVEGGGALISPGEDTTLMNGDKFTVYADEGVRAGFCKTYADECNDGIDTGEYKITIKRP